jgi:hypothetical protein
MHRFRTSVERSDLGAARDHIFCALACHDVERIAEGSGIASDEVCMALLTTSSIVTVANGTRATPSAIVALRIAFFPRLSRTTPFGRLRLNSYLA